MRTILATLLLGLSSAPAGTVTLVAGGGDGPDGSPATRARLASPFGVDFDRGGNLYLVEYTGHRVRKVDSGGLITTIAGTGEKGNAGDGGPARQARFNGIHSLAIAPNGDLFVADTFNNRVRKVDARTGVITPFAGTGAKGFSGDGGPAAQARFGGVYCVALDPKGERLYLADLDNRRIRVIDLKTNVVTTVAGNGQKGAPPDGAEARSAPLVDPRAVAVDASGNIYILERSGHALRVVDPSGRVRTVAGTGKAGPADASGPALHATLRGPKHLCIDRDGDVLIADSDNHMIREYRPRDGTLLRVAGTGRKGSGGLGGPPEQVELDQPHGVYVHPSGTIYVSDSSNHRVLKIER